jgi:hypothetical protein
VRDFHSRATRTKPEYALNWLTQDAVLLKLTMKLDDFG